MREREDVRNFMFKKRHKKIRRYDSQKPPFDIFIFFLEVILFMYILAVILLLSYGLCLFFY